MPALRIPALMMLVLITLAAAPASAERRPTGPDPDLANRLQTLLNQHLASSPTVSGELLAVVGPGAAWSWAGAAGSVSQGGEALRADDAFRIASVTKPFTAAAILRLMEERRLDIDAAIGPLISPETAALLKEGGYAPDQITVRQLLTHSSGLYDHAADARYAEAAMRDLQHRWTRTEQIGLAIHYGKPLGAPGERFSYSDTGYVVLGEIIERATHEDLGKSVRHLVRPERAGLTSTWWEVMEAAPRQARMAHSYYGADDFTAANPSFDLHGGGGVISTAGDLARFYRSLVLGEFFHQKRTLVVMMSASSATSERRIDTNAVHLLEVGRHQCWGHTGFWGTVAAYCPTLDIAFAWTQNQAQGGRAGIRDALTRLAEALEPASAGEFPKPRR